MNPVNKKLLDGSNFVEDCYVAQTKAFAPGEYLFIEELIRKNNVRAVLDIGTGDGGFISGLADAVHHVSFDAIDAAAHLIAIAKKKNKKDNVVYDNSLFDRKFPLKKYDLILSRFAVEHLSDVPGFITEAFRRLNKGGILLITEYYIDDLNSGNETWKMFRRRELKFYQGFGSHGRISTELARYMLEKRFTGIETLFRYISPAISGRKVFYDLVRTYAVLYNNFDKKNFPDKIKAKIIDYCNTAINDGNIEDGLLISHTTGRKA